MIAVTCRVQIYERDGEDVFGNEEFLEVLSHRLWREFVVLRLGETEIVVPARDLITAVENATNTGRR